MYSLRKWLYKPKKTDTSLLAQFYHSDEELYLVASELDSFDGRRDPERCAMLVNELRFWQDSVLNTIEKVMDDAIPQERTTRDFRVKFPDDVLHESLAGQLWFGAECLAAGSIIMNREVESACMRPLARALTKNLDSLRAILRDQCLRNINTYTDKVKEALIIFDKLLAEFELSYVSSMVPVKTMKEYDMMQDVIVLFSETLHRALRMKLLTQDLVDDYEPAVMFTIPRLAIVCGLLVYPEGPLNPDNNPQHMSEMFRPFQTLLYKIRELLYTLSAKELYLLEKLLCSQDHSMTLADDYLSFTDYSHQRHVKKPTLPCPAHSAQSPSRDVPNSLPCDSPECDAAAHIIVHSPGSGGSPVTPINDESDAGDFPSHGVSSASIATLTAGQRSVDDPDSDNASLEDDETDMSLRHDIAAIIEVISPTADETSVSRGEDRGKIGGGQRAWQRDSDSGLQSDCGSVGEVMAANGAQCCDAASDQGSSESCPRHETTEAGQGHVACGCHPRGTGRDTSQTDITCDCVCDSNTNCAAVEGACEWCTRGGDDENRAPCNDGAYHGAPVQDSSEVCDMCKGFSDASVNQMPSIDEQEVIYTEHSSVETTSLHDTNHSEHALNVRQETENNPTSLVTANDGEIMKKLCDPSPHRKHVHQTNVPNEKLSTNNEYVSTTKPCSNPRTGHAHNKRICPRHKTDHCSLSNPVIPSEVKVTRKDKSKYGSCACCRCDNCTDCGVSCGTSIEPDTDSIASSDTSSYNSESHNDEEIALAIHAAEIVSCSEVRARFQSSSDLIHRLFVCVSGVADQLQTNYASDLRNILKCVFDMCCTEPPVDDKQSSITMATNHRPSSISRSSSTRETPTWLPDVASSSCMGCHVPFTLMRRRHHCRNCGKLFCSRCSSNAVPLPHFGHPKPVRVCIRCFIYHVTPFTVSVT